LRRVRIGHPVEESREPIVFGFGGAADQDTETEQERKDGKSAAALSRFPEAIHGTAFRNSEREFDHSGERAIQSMAAAIPDPTNA
jgi:hypothetical protein